MFSRIISKIAKKKNNQEDSSKDESNKSEKNESNNDNYAEDKIEGPKCFAPDPSTGSFANNLNIDVYFNQSDNLLYLRFDVLCNSFHAERFGQLKSLYDFVLAFVNKGPYLNEVYSELQTTLVRKSIYKKILEGSSDSHITFYKHHFYSRKKPVLLHAGLPRTYTHLSIVYQIPTQASVLINWIAFYALLIDSINPFLKENAHVQFGNHLWFNNLSESTKIENLFCKENIRNKSVRYLMQKIVSMGSMLAKDMLLLKAAVYQQAFANLKIVNDSCSGIVDGGILMQLVYWVSSHGRCRLFYSDQFKSFKQHISFPEKQKFVIDMAKEINCKNEFLFRLNELNSLAQIKFLQTRLLYRCDYVEMELRNSGDTLLFCHAEFKLLKDGCIEIANLDKNIGYQFAYAKGKERYHLFDEDIKRLVFYLGLDLQEGQENQNFHETNRIIFNEESSKQLIAQGLHLNAAYFKAIFQARQDWAFFTRLRLASNNCFSMLNEDVLDQILFRANTFNQSYFRAGHSLFFQAVNAGKKQGGIQEIKETVFESSFKTF
jgi:hypothetical protein